MGWSMERLRREKVGKDGRDERGGGRGGRREEKKDEGMGRVERTKMNIKKMGKKRKVKEGKENR